MLIIQSLLAVFLIILVLLQSKGTGLSKSVSLINTNSFARRGLERLIFKMTFVLAALFIVSSILQVL